MGSTRESLVLGFVAGLPPSYVEPFSRSLRASGYQGRFVLIVGKYSAPDRAELAAMADVIVDIDAIYLNGPAPAVVEMLRLPRETPGLRRFYPALFGSLLRLAPERRALHAWRHLEYQLEGLQALRYAHYYDFIRVHAPAADKILLTDIRDVIFQDDPFDAPVSGLEVFLEEEFLAIGKDPHNARWIQNLYGRRALERIGSMTTSCSGTTVGDRESILDYLQAMTESIVWRRRPMGSHDQGVHNHLLRSGRLSHADVVRNGHGRVLTMGAMQHFERDASGRVLNADGSVPAVVHQYDRHQVLRRELLAALVPAG